MNCIKNLTISSNFNIIHGMVRNRTPKPSFRNIDMCTTQDFILQDCCTLCGLPHISHNIHQMIFCIKMFKHHVLFFTLLGISWFCHSLILYCIQLCKLQPYSSSLYAFVHKNKKYAALQEWYLRYFHMLLSFILVTLQVQCKTYSENNQKFFYHEYNQINIIKLVTYLLYCCTKYLGQMSYMPFKAKKNPQQLSASYRSPSLQARGVRLGKTRLWSTGTKERKRQWNTTKNTCSSSPTHGACQQIHSRY